MAHEGIDIDGLLDEFDALGTPTPIKARPQVNHFQSRDTRTTSPSLFVPHPPSKNKSPTLINPKNKFAVESRQSTPSPNDSPTKKEDDLDMLINLIQNSTASPAAVPSQAFSPHKMSANTIGSSTRHIFGHHSPAQTSSAHSRGSFSHTTDQTVPSSSSAHGAAQHTTQPVKSSSSSHKSHTQQSDLDWDDDWDQPLHALNTHTQQRAGHTVSAQNSAKSSSVSAKNVSLSTQPSTTQSMPVLSVPTGSASTSAKQGGKTRCSRVVLGGTDLARGLKVSTFSKVCCDALLCAQCNFKVLSFPHCSWTSAVDYLFVRNHMPNVEKLRERLTQHAPTSSEYNSVAYCCQCKWVSLSTERTLTPGKADDPQWICTGHSNV